MTTYCNDCGKRIEHKALEKPNFCPKCGYSFLKGKSTPPPDVVANAETIGQEEIVELDVNLTELDFDVEYDMSSKGITIGNAIDKSGSIEPRQRAVGNEKKRKRISKKQQAANEKRFLDDFRSEAGTSRTK